MQRVSFCFSLSFLAFSCFCRLFKDGCLTWLLLSTLHFFFLIFQMDFHVTNEPPFFHTVQKKKFKYSLGLLSIMNTHSQHIKLTGKAQRNPELFAWMKLERKSVIHWVGFFVFCFFSHRARRRGEKGRSCRTPIQVNYLNASPPVRQMPGEKKEWLVWGGFSWAWSCVGAL